MGGASEVVIGLSAVIVGVRGPDAVILSVGDALPFGPFDPENDRTFELALRAYVAAQTGFGLGWVEQLYTFGDKGRDAPVADLGAGAARVISVGYLALAGPVEATPANGAEWSPWTAWFPWEDWRDGRPAVIAEQIAPALEAWSRDAAGEERASRRARAAVLFALDGAPWKEERVLERYELLYEAGLTPESRRDRGLPPDQGLRSLGRPMRSDHRRILATGLGRLRGKLRYRPVAFELTPAEFTLSELQRTVEAVTGVRSHKQNFRRALERTGLVEPLGRQQLETGGRPAALYRFARERAAAGPAIGLALPR